MKPKNLLMIGVGAVVLYFVWQKFGKNDADADADANGETKANAKGRLGTSKHHGICYCSGEMYPRTCSPWHTCEQCCPSEKR